MSKSPQKMRLDDLPFEVELRPHPRARRMKLRYDATKRGALITVPPGTSQRQAQRFIDQNLDWLIKQHQKYSDIPKLADHQVIPFKGIEHYIVFDKNLPAGVTRTDHDELIVGGPEESAPTRLYNWLKKQARLELEKTAPALAEKLGVEIHKIHIRDTKSRWGSCSSRRVISFSWRLILCTPKTLKYVAAHEVAHIREMNHSADFWRLVETLMPDYETHRQWLKIHGPGLMAIQA